MARTPTVTRSQVPEQFRAAFYRETAASGGVVATGPGSAMINSPDIRERSNHLVKYFREVSDLPQKIQELEMLLTTRHIDCQYIWYAHSVRGRQEGLSDELVDALRDKKPLPSLPPDEAALVNYANELFATHKVSQATFDTALAMFGAQRLTELTTMMGYYSILAFNANTFEIDLPSGGAEPVLPV